MKETIKIRELNSGEVILLKLMNEPKVENRFCNICMRPYEANSKFERFCTSCKNHNELYHFHEWLSAS